MIRFRFIAAGLLVGCTATHAEGQTAQPMRLNDQIALFENGLRAPIRAAGAVPTLWTLSERMRHYKIPGVSIAVTHEGDVVWSKGYGTRRQGHDLPVDTKTLFSAGSFSKTATAIAVLRLVDQQELNLEAPINTQLKSWTLEIPRPSDWSEPSLRMLLSHTAGINVHGFADFQPAEPLPDTVQILNGSPPAKSDAVQLIHKPGSVFDYSGGGYTIAGLAVSDTLSLSFPESARNVLFKPLSLERSTFAVPLPEATSNIAFAHNDMGQPDALARGYESFPETAASGLWSNPTEYAHLLNALWSDAMRSPEKRFVSHQLALEALTPVYPSSHGLGPRIIRDGLVSRMVHTGSNQSYKALYDIRIEDGSGIVIMTNSANGHLIFPEILAAAAHAMGWHHHRQLQTIDIFDGNQTRFLGVYAVKANPGMKPSTADADAPRLINISVMDERLYIQESQTSKIDNDTLRTELFAIAPTKLVTRDGRRTFDFMQTPSGTIETMTYREDGVAQVYTRMD